MYDALLEGRKIYRPLYFNVEISRNLIGICPSRTVLFHWISSCVKHSKTIFMRAVHMSKLINSTNRIRLILLIGIFEILAAKRLIDVHLTQFYRYSRIRWRLAAST